MQSDAGTDVDTDLFKKHFYIILYNSYFSYLPALHRMPKTISYSTIVLYSRDIEGVGVIRDII